MGWVVNKMDSLAHVHNEKGAAKTKLFFHNVGPPHSPAIVVVGATCHRVGGTVEKAARSQRAHTVVLVSRAVEAVRTGLQYHIRHRTGGASKLSRVVAGTHVHRLDGFRRRDSYLQQPRAR